MSELLDRILGLDGVRFADGSAHLEWARAIPPWGWGMVLLAAIAAAAWSYWRLRAVPWARSLLVGLRIAILIMLVTILAGPQLVRRSERTEQDWVLVLLDRSASMHVADVNGSDGGTISRDAQLRSAMLSAQPVFDAIGKERHLVQLGFDRGAFDISEPQNLPPASGAGTNIGTALEQAMRRVVARPVSGVVVLSDGRSADTPSRGLLRRLQDEQVPVIVVPLGSPEPLTDLAIQEARAPSPAFIGDIVPVNVRVDRFGAPRDPAHPVTLELVDSATGTVLDTQPLPADSDSTLLTLTAKPAAPGSLVWTVRLRADTPDLSPENDTVNISLEMLDRPIRVLLIDGSPRWEYRYVKNLLLRENSIRCACMLLASDRRFLQEGTTPLASVPTTQAEWGEWDVIILGDVRAGLFSNEQLEALREQVSTRGTGLLWIGGPAATPGTWAGTALADLLPFTLTGDNSAGNVLEPWSEPVTVRRTPASERLGLMELGDNAKDGWPKSLSDPVTGWSQLRFAQRIAKERMKPTAEVIAEAIPLSATDLSAEPASQPGPLVLTMRYGAGSSVYVATDEIWRYRYGRGEPLTERFWLPLIRMLARESLGRTGRAAAIEATPTKALVDQPVRVAIKLLDQSLLEGRPESLTVRATPEDPTAPGATIKLLPETTGEGPASSFATTWLPGHPGTFTLEPIDAILNGLGLAARVEVVVPDDELREPQTDHPFLADLAAQTKGKVLSPDQLDQIPELLPNRQLRILGAAEIETLWDKPAVLILLLTLLTLEWAGRRLVRLS